MSSRESSHFILMRSFEKLIDLCHQHRLGFWLDAGTFLGAIRHGNIIPWDYDIDIGMLDTDYRRLLELFAEHGNVIGDLTLDSAYYAEPDACCCIYEGSDNSLGIDVVAYRVNGDLCETLMTQELQDAYPFQYNHRTENVFPLRTVPLLGNWVQVPTRIEAVLTDMYSASFMQYPEEDFAEWNATLPASEVAWRVKPPFRLIAEATSVERGLAERSQPFIARNTAAGFPSRERVRAAMLAENSVYGYRDDSPTQHLEPAQALELWQQDRLDINIVDSESRDHSLVPAVIRENAIESDELERACSYVVTNRNSRTRLHADPKWGGGWMQLYSGCKLWWIILEQDVAHLESLGHGIEALAALLFSELVHLADGYLWGKIYVGSCRANDFIYFPEGAAHAVITYEPAFGLGGYV